MSKQPPTVTEIRDMDEDERFEFAEELDDRPEPDEYYTTSQGRLFRAIIREQVADEEVSPPPELFDVGAYVSIEMVPDDESEWEILGKKEFPGIIVSCTNEELTIEIDPDIQNPYPEYSRFTVEIPGLDFRGEDGSEYLGEVLGVQLTHPTAGSFDDISEAMLHKMQLARLSVKTHVEWPFAYPERAFFEKHDAV